MYRLDKISVPTVQDRHRTAIEFPDAALVIYDGQEFAGAITRRDGRYIAHDVRGHELGAFATLRNACRAIPTAP